MSKEVSEKHRAAARKVLVGRRLAFANESGPSALIDGIAAALAKVERDTFNRAASAAPDMLEALPDLSCVINWLENGCDVSEAAKELRIYKARIDAAIAKAKGQ